MRDLHDALARLPAACRRFGPYLLLELLLPGGTLMAILFYVVQRVRAGGLGCPALPARLVAAARWTLAIPGRPATGRWLDVAPCVPEAAC